LKELGGFGEVIAICVRDDDQTRAAVLSGDGVLSGMNRGAILAIHSTVSPRLISELNEATEKAGVELVDAPVSGGERGAIAKTMSYMVGGTESSVARCAPLFAASGQKVTHTGSVGSAAKAKIVHQLIICVNMMAAHEGMRMGIAAGLSPEILTKVIHEGGAQSRMADNWFTLSLRPHAVGVFDKDLSLCLAFAAELGLETPGAALAKKQIDEIVP
jgi:3-hydroxyisobutyrate dehydrogenase-like beta-hydroxyacid dehydrogenase